MILVKYLRDTIFFIPLVFIGWVQVFLRLLSFFYSKWLKKNSMIRISVIVFFIQLLFATRPWFEYQIQFNEVDEVLSVSSKVNLIFISLSLANFILLVKYVSFSPTIVLVIQSIIGILFLLGYQSPTSIHVDFVNPADYHFNYNFYIFFIVLLLGVALSIRNYLNRSKNPEL